MNILSNRRFIDAKEISGYVFQTFCSFVNSFPEEIRSDLDENILMFVVSNLHIETHGKTCSLLLEFIESLAKASCPSLVDYVPKVLTFLFEQFASDKLLLHDRALKCLCCIIASFELADETMEKSITAVGNLYDKLANHSQGKEDELDDMLIRAECVKSLGKFLTRSSSKSLKEYSFFCMERILMAFMGPEKETILREAALESLADVISVLEQAFQPFLDIVRWRCSSMRQMTGKRLDDVGAGHSTVESLPGSFPDPGRLHLPGEG